jgi:hypothetical protein
MKDEKILQLTYNCSSFYLTSQNSPFYCFGIPPQCSNITLTFIANPLYCTRSDLLVFLFKSCVLSAISLNMILIHRGFLILPDYTIFPESYRGLCVYGHSSDIQNRPIVFNLTLKIKEHFQVIFYSWAKQYGTH